MEIIDKISYKIEDEIQDAEEYARDAIEVRDEWPGVAEAFMKLSEEEMKHMNLLHEQVVIVINDYKAKNKTVPEDMKRLYDILHRHHINQAATAKAIQAMYRT